MFKKIGLGIVVMLLIAIGFIWFKLVIPFQDSADKFGPETAARDYALQDNSKLTLPVPQAAVYQAAPNPNQNLYWGELHVHTAESFDATLFGNTLGIEDAYRFAKGEPLSSAGGEIMQLAALWTLSQLPITPKASAPAPIVAPLSSHFVSEQPAGWPTNRTQGFLKCLLAWLAVLQP